MSRVTRSALPSLQSEISILNAEKYGELPRSPPESRADDIVVNGKRSSPSDHDEEDGVQKKRSRGRPRLDTKDETAADRRRTQIRLAQRAYRHRKDTAITTLEQRVKDLEASNEAMSKEFTNFYDIILSEGIFDLAPHAAPRLRLIADRLLRISSMVETGNITPPESDDPITAKPAVTGKGANDITADLAAQAVVLEPEFATSFSNTQQHHPTAFNYEVIAQATPNNASFPFFAAFETTTTSQPQSSSYLSNPSPYPRLSPPVFGFTERTFSKRLQKTTLERGLRLATMKNPPPEQYATVFGFCLLFESRDAIIRRLAAGLKRVQNESLDWKMTSSDQFGFLDNAFATAGADDLGHALLSLGKPTANFSGLTASFGQQPPASSDERTEQRIRMICQNFEGEFFTADEVELFLRKIGLVIPPNVDYFETELDLNDLQAADEASTKNLFSGIGLSPGSSGLGSGNSSSNNNSNSMWHMNASSMGDLSSALRGDSSEGQNTRKTVFGEESDLAGEVAAFLNSHDLGQMWSTGSSWPKTKVSVDVRRLIDELGSRSVCLGRVPGVRPKDVIRAVKIAAGLPVTTP
ncbi:hypothetical protein M419DRAFT_133906 [Trichoderma reesei RUT C-30]|uniref:BZIP domain-containing protein n=1 Tax=Hypocrea jecorina (strain ATCC 56765 / BCRC 32924 / NRRL 11460 / Rut C-30) TaxID=1344414 RepID=A0A024RY80_HYPJR|nr:hypothetical protein M419DRAFT_133906 [Trichoderma reesei RUT C-30]